MQQQQSIRSCNCSMFLTHAIFAAFLYLSFEILILLFTFSSFLQNFYFCTTFDFLLNQSRLHFTSQSMLDALALALSRAGIMFKWPHCHFKGPSYLQQCHSVIRSLHHSFIHSCSQQITTIQSLCLFVLLFQFYIVLLQLSACPDSQLLHHLF